MNDERPTRLIPKGHLTTPQHILEQVNERVENLEQIFIVTKDKDGNFEEYLCGTLTELCYSIVLLQKLAMEQI